jgi:hypothetical protein
MSTKTIKDLIINDTRHAYSHHNLDKEILKGTHIDFKY